MWLKRRVWFGLAAVLAVLLGFYLAFRAPVVAVAAPTRGPAVEAVYATGTVEPVHYAEVASKITSRVTEVRVREGERVVQGDVLAVLNPQEDASNVAQLRAQLTLAENDLTRSRALREKGHIAASALDRVVSARNSARASLDAAQARLDEQTIKAPLDGVVMRLPNQVKPGDMAQMGQVLFVVGEPSQLRIEAEVDEEDIPRVKSGQEALLRADAFATHDLKGRVSELTPFGDPVARTYRVYIALPADTPLLSGMTAEINIIISRKSDAMLIPATSLSGSHIWVVENGKTKLQKVDVGAVGQEKVEIRSGLDAGARVIVNPAGLKEGLRVRTRETD